MLLVAVVLPKGPFGRKIVEVVVVLRRKVGWIHRSNGSAWAEG